MKYHERLTDGWLLRTGGSLPPEEKRRQLRLGDDGTDLGRGTFSGELRTRSDVDLEYFWNPPTDQTIREVSHEVEHMRLTGKLHPFVEGQPIGVLPRRKRVRPKSEAHHRRARNGMMERHRGEMLALRAKNDRIIKEILE